MDTLQKESEGKMFSLETMEGRILMKDSDQNYRSARYSERAKRRKTNIILNSLIVVVLGLIIVVAVNIFNSGSEKADVQKQTPPTTKQTDNKGTSNKTKPNKESNQSAKDNVQKEKDEKKDEKEVKITEGGAPNVKKTIENPNWKPVETSQSGEHVAVYDSSSVDWQEMLKAIGSAIDTDPNNMVVWFLENGGPNRSIGTVSVKGKEDQTFRVYIEWVDQKGWKPVKVEELIQNDKR